MNERPSGWYDDPDDDTQLRYWDGILWSDRTMPKLRPGLDHVGEARPVQHVEEPPRRDGEPRTYPAHWGPEQSGRRDEFHGPQFQGSQPGTAPFGNTVGQPSGLIRRILATFLDRLIVSLPVSLVVLPFLGDWMTQMQEYVDRFMSAASAGEQMPTIPADLMTPPLALAGALVAALFVYEVLMTHFAGGATVGKRALGITVVPAGTAQGATERLPLGRAALRALMKWGPDALALVAIFSGVAGFLQALMILWALSNAKRQGLHDLAVKSEVRRTR